MPSLWATDKINNERGKPEMQIDVREFQKLKNEIDVLNDRIKTANIRKEEAIKKKEAILQSYGVSSIEELEKLTSEKEAELEKLLLAAQSFIIKSKPVLEEVERKLNGIN